MTSEQPRGFLGPLGLARRRVKPALKTGVVRRDWRGHEGQADDLGGGVFKKRLNKNMHRGIILARGGRNWIYAYLFAKKDRSNIEDDELADFRTLAKGYATLSEEQVSRLVANGDLTEICHDRKKWV